MQINPLPAITGWSWVKEGFRLLRRQPIALLALTFMNLFLLSLSVLIPLAGSVAPLVLTPALMAGLMRAVRSADEGQTPTPGMLFSAFREQGGRAVRPLLMLGGFNALVTILALTLSAMTDDGTLMRVATGQIGADDPALQDASLIRPALVFLVLYTPVQMAMWYAPLFVAWNGVPVRRALFYSFVGVLRNRRAFLVYAAGWLGIGLAAALLVRLMQGLLGGSPMLLSAVMSPLSLILLTTVYCSFWPTYRDAVVGD
ncbi:MAG: BPSS1780 family membrane protein [Burkholderiaceae bacterium]